MIDTIWNMTFGDALKAEILRISSTSQKNLFYNAYLRMERHIYEHEEDSSLTFGEYYKMFEE